MDSFEASRAIQQQQQQPTHLVPSLNLVPLSCLQFRDLQYLAPRYVSHLSHLEFQGSNQQVARQISSSSTKT